MKKLLLVSIFFVLATRSTFGFDQIVRPYQSVRSSGMGGVYETTGLYDQNFFGNPARVTANPSWRITLFDPMVETDNSAISHVSAVTSSGDTVRKVAETAGSDNHLRLQTTMPAYYLPVSQSRKWAIAVALITSEQLDFGLENNFQTDTQSDIDVGPAVTFGHTFLDDDSLSVGVTGHFVYRLTSKTPFTVADFLNGTSFSPKNTGGEGTLIDFDLGVTKRLSHWHPLDLDIDLALSVDNILGGKFSHGSFHPVNAPNAPNSYGTAFGGGVSVHRASLVALRDVVVALEASDVGPRNRNGSIFRTIHMGGETRVIGILLPRIGINQGYFAAGLGVDLKFVTIDAATYGEELGLNTGDMQDRRYALRLAFQL